KGSSTQTFRKMEINRDKFKSEIVKLTQDIANIQQVQDSLDAALVTLQEAGDQKNSFDGIVCHDNCHLTYTNNPGTDYFKDCACMLFNKACIKCGCGPLSHFHDNVKLIEETKTIDSILEDIDKENGDTDKQYQEDSDDTYKYQVSIETLQAATNSKYEHIHKFCHDLSKNCITFNFTDELHANIESMKQDAKILQSSGLRKIAEAQIERLEKLA
ncbi:5866_t:CDS:2, partial [Acaulospora colombiana]